MTLTIFFPEVSILNCCQVKQLICCLYEYILFEYELWVAGTISTRCSDMSLQNIQPNSLRYSAFHEPCN